MFLLTYEVLLVLTILTVGHISSLPKPTVTIEAIDQESELKTAECDAAGGDWHLCTLKEMKRTMKP